MNVLVVGNGFTRYEMPDRNYVNIHTARFLLGLAEAGHAVAIAQPIVEVVSEGGLNNADLGREDVRVVELNKGRPWRLLEAIRALKNADFVYIFFPGTWPRVAGLLCRWMKKPYALYVRGEQFSNRGLDAKLLSFAVALITETGLEKRVVEHNSRYIPISPMIEMGDRDQLRRDYERGLGRPLRLLFVGRLEAAKGVPELLEAARILVQRAVPFELRLVGGGPLYDELSSLKKSDPSLPFDLVGLVADKSEMMKEYEWADVLVLPSHHEGFPRVIFEAMIKSCVIVTTMVGGIPAIMHHGRNCLELEIGKPDMIVDAIELLNSNVDLLQRLSDAGRETVLKILNDQPTHLNAVKKVIDEQI